MKIDLTTLKRIARQTPELTVAQFVAVWSEKIEEQARERDRERHRKQPEMKPENERKRDGNPPTYAEQEKALYAFADKVCGGRAGGMVGDLLKQNGRDLVAVRTILERAQGTHDPRAFVAGNIRKQGNGSGRPNLAATFDDLIDRADGREGGAGATIIDVTPGRAAER